MLGGNQIWLNQASAVRLILNLGLLEPQLFCSLIGYIRISWTYV